jgi:WD40 repeat protein
VLTGSRDKTAILWDAATGNQLRIFAVHTDQVNSVAWSVDGKQVMTDSYDGTAVLWEAATGKKRVQTGSGVGSPVPTAVLWEAATGKKRQTFRVYAK